MMIARQAFTNEPVERLAGLDGRFAAF